MKLHLSGRAQQDLEDLWDFIAADSIGAADRILDEILAAIETTADFPHVGRLREELGADVRSCHVGQYLIFYRVRNAVEVLRVLSGARDLTHLFPP